MRALLIVLALMVSPALAQDGPVAPDDVAPHAIEQFIRPGFIDLQEKVQALGFRVGRLCDDPTAADRLLDARTAFADAAVAYARVEWLRLGPLVEQNRLEALLLWPDPRGIALKQVQAALAAKDPTVTDVAKLRQKSVALRGFTALEYLLYGTDAEDELTQQGAKSFRCEFAFGVSAAMFTEVVAIAGAWWDEGADQITARLIAPSPTDPSYRSTREVLEEFAGQLAFGIEAIRDQRILPFLGRDRFIPKPKSALFWRSGLTIPVIYAGIKGMRDFFALSRIGAAGENSLWLEQSGVYVFDTALKILDRVPGPIEWALTDNAQVHALDELIAQTSTIQTLVGDNLATVLGLSVGFSSLDGD